MGKHLPRNHLLEAVTLVIVLLLTLGAFVAGYYFMEYFK